jgi:hypothetical protein
MTRPDALSVSLQLSDFRYSPADSVEGPSAGGITGQVLHPTPRRSGTVGRTRNPAAPG